MLSRVLTWWLWLLFSMFADGEPAPPLTRLVLLSDDIYQSVMVSISGGRSSGSRPSLGYLLRNNRLLTLTTDLDRRLFQKCNNNENSNKQLDTTSSNCSFVTSSFSAISSSSSSSSSSSIRIVTARISERINIDRMKRFCRLIKTSFFLDAGANSQTNQQLSSILIVASGRLIAMFRLFCSHELPQVVISGVDMLKMGAILELKHSFLDRFQVKWKNQSLSSSLSSMSPSPPPPPSPPALPTTTIDVFLDIIDHFRNVEKLEHINLFVSDPQDKHMFRSSSKPTVRYIKHAASTSELLSNLKKLILIPDPATFSTSAAAAASFSQHRHHYFHHSSTSNPSFSSSKSMKQLVSQRIGLERAFEHLSASFLNKNDLIIIKTDVDTLATILDTYTAVRRKHLSYLTPSKTSSRRPAVKFEQFSSNRRLIWIPDMLSTQTNLSLASWLDKARSLLDKSNLCSLNILIFNSLLSLDTLLVLDPLSQSTPASLVSYSFKSVTSFFSTSAATNRTATDQFEFKMRDGELFVQDPSVFVESGENAYVKLASKIKQRIAEDSAHAMKKSRPVYRIVSNHIEPFVIVSKLVDEDLQNQTDCNDGLLCLMVDSAEDLTFSGSFEALLTREFIIDLIMTYRRKTNDEIKAIKSMRARTKCCTGYMVNILQRLSADLEFDFEFYLSPQKRFGSYNQSTDSWSGALNHVANGVAHIIAGPFSITHERSQYIDFSMPFLYSGYALLIKQEKKGVDDLFMFMRPFSYLHWALIGVFALGSAISLALLEFNSPFGLNPMGRQRARNYTLGSAISMVISLMFMHTMPAKSPKSWAGKWTQNFIASFALIFIATYTAQMASILSAGQDSKAFSGIHDTELLNLKRGYLSASSIESHMCNKSKDYYNSHCQNSLYLKSDHEGVASVLNGTLDVYMSDHILLNYLRYMQTDCNLKITGDEFGTTGYSLGMSKDMTTEEKNAINVQILEYYEIGYLDELHNKWFNKRMKCNRKAADDKIRIDVDQYKGVYLYLGLGIIAAILVLFIEHYLYKWTIPFLRSKPNKSEWKSLKLMFISQRFYRIVHSEEYYDASHSAKEFINVFKRRDFEAIFQKSFRKKQLESLHGSQLRKRPKLWALIEASTERRSRDLINRSSSSDNLGEGGEEEHLGHTITDNNDLTMNETDATSSPTQAAAATAAVAVAVAVVPTTTPKTPKTPTSPTTPTVITIPKLLPKIKLPLMKKSSSERLRELQALENIKKLHQQQPSQPPSTQPNPLRKQLKKQEVTTKPDSPDDEQETSLIIDNNKTTEPPEKQQTDKKATTLKKFDRKESDNRIIVVEEYASIVVTDSDEKDEQETNGENNSNSNIKQPEEMANFMCEFDEFVFSSDVATPALEEPEVFDINGSSTSLINTPTTAIPTIRIEGEQANSPSSSLLDNTADNNGANNSRAREYKLIHSMFAKKSRLDKNNSKK